MRFHYISRGIVFVRGSFLLVREKGAGNSFLPGGHVEGGESAVAALAREIQEELGLEAAVGGFVGAVEHLWPERNPLNHEINLIFEVRIPHIDPGTLPVSREAHLEFLWAKPSDLEKVDLLPAPMIRCLRDWIEGRGGFWCTTIDSGGTSHC